MSLTFYVYIVKTRRKFHFEADYFWSKKLLFISCHGRIVISPILITRGEVETQHSFALGHISLNDLSPRRWVESIVSVDFISTAKVSPLGVSMIRSTSEPPSVR